VGLDIKGRPF